MPAPPFVYFTLLSALLISCFSCLVPARAANLFSLVAKAAAAKRQITFEGRQEISTFAANDAEDAHWVRIVADVTQSGSMARMVYVLPSSARGRIVIDDGHWVRQWEAGRPAVLVEQSREESAPAQRRMLRLLQQNYVAHALGRQRVSGLWCEEVAVRPRPGHVGPTRVLWIERHRFAVLRAAEYDVSGYLQYTSVYKEFHYKVSVPQGAFTLPAEMPRRWIGPVEQEEKDFHAAFHAVSLPERLPCWLPTGYALVSCALVRSKTSGRAVVLRYGDGLKSIMVVEAPDSTRILLDAALPPSFQTSLLAALAPKTEVLLQHALAQEFGTATLPQTRRLRRQGWGYDAIAAWYLCGHVGHMAPFVNAQPPTRDEHAALRWISHVMHNPPFFRSAEGVMF